MHVNRHPCHKEIKQTKHVQVQGESLEGSVALVYKAGNEARPTTLVPKKGLPGTLEVIPEGP